VRPNALRLSCGRLARHAQTYDSLSVAKAPATAQALAVRAPASCSRRVRQPLLGRHLPYYLVDELSRLLGAGALNEKPQPQTAAQYS